MPPERPRRYPGVAEPVRARSARAKKNLGLRARAKKNLGLRKRQSGDFAAGMAPGTYTRTEADVDMNEEATLRAMEGPPLDDGIEHLIDRPAERWATEVAGWGAR